MTSPSAAPRDRRVQLGDLRSRRTCGRGERSVRRSSAVAGGRGRRSRRACPAGLGAVRRRSGRRRRWSVRGRAVRRSSPGVRPPARPRRQPTGRASRPRPAARAWRRSRGTRMRPSCTTVTASLPSAVKIEPRPEAAAARGGRGVLVVQQPLVGAERPVEPHGVVEARHLNALVVASCSRGAAAWCRAASCRDA